MGTRGVVGYETLDTATRVINLWAMTPTRSALKCKIDGCNHPKPPIAFGLCPTHYQRRRRAEKDAAAGTDTVRRPLEAVINKHVAPGGSTAKPTKLRVDASLRKALDELAEQQGTTPSAMAREALEAWCARQEGGEKFGQFLIRAVENDRKKCLLPREYEFVFALRPGTSQLVREARRVLAIKLADAGVTEATVIRAVLWVYIAGRLGR